MKLAQDDYSWCKAGTIWSDGSADDLNLLVIEGVAQYNGKAYCHAVYSGEPLGKDAFVIDYYFIEEKGRVVDLWEVMRDAQGNALDAEHRKG